MILLAMPGVHQPRASANRKNVAKTLGVIVHRPSAAGSARLLVIDGVVDVDDPDRSQRNIGCGQPVEELIGRGPIISNRLFGQPAVTAHPRLVGINFGAMAMAGLVGFVEPAEKAQPSDRVVDKACSRLE
jgi:hypothetical protein